VYRYTPAGKSTTYLLNTKAMPFRDAQGYCNAQGGHLASWASYTEQFEVESAFTQMVGQQEALPWCCAH
jgi:hypothetical protein